MPPPPSLPVLPLDSQVARPATALLASCLLTTVECRRDHGHPEPALPPYSLPPLPEPVTAPVPGHPQEKVDNVLWTGFSCHQETEEETHLQVL